MQMGPSCHGNREPEAETGRGVEEVTPLSLDRFYFFCCFVEFSHGFLLSWGFSLYGYFSLLCYVVDC